MSIPEGEFYDPPDCDTTDAYGRPVDASDVLDGEEYATWLRERRGRHG